MRMHKRKQETTENERASWPDQARTLNVAPPASKKRVASAMSTETRRQALPKHGTDEAAHAVSFEAGRGGMSSLADGGKAPGRKGSRDGETV